MAFTLKSSAFTHEAMIPSEYTCDGKNISPELSWDGVPDGTKSLALIADDPDAPSKTWVHWVVFNLPPDTRKLPENFTKTPELENGTIQGITSFRKNGYGGPCPPGGTHRYYFKLYALDTLLDLGPSAEKSDVVQAMDGHLLGQAVLMGRYTRRQ